MFPHESDISGSHSSPMWAIKNKKTVINVPFLVTVHNQIEKTVNIVALQNESLAIKGNSLPFALPLPVPTSCL